MKYINPQIQDAQLQVQYIQKKPKTRQKPTRYAKVKPLKRKPRKNIKSSQRGGNLFKQIKELYVTGKTVRYLEHKREYL